MKLERIVIVKNTTDWRGRPETQEREYITITKKEIEDLRTWLVSSQVSLKGFKGKLYFHKDVEFPRYKFTEYSRNNNKIVRRVRDIKNADVVVMDTNYFIPQLDQILKDADYYSKELLGKGVTNSNNLPVYTDVTDQNKSMAIKRCCYGAYDNRRLVLETLVELYNTKQNLKSVSVYELNDVITKTGCSIDSEMSENLKNLLNSNDPASIKLAMEIMTNSDFEASLFHIVLLCSLFAQKMINNSYWNSTAFKSFRNNMERLSLNIEYLRGNTTIDAIEKFFSLDNKFIFEEDIDFVKKLIKEEVDGQYSLDSTGFEITGYEINLKLDPNKIIKREKEEEKQPIEESKEEENETPNESFTLTN